MIHFVIVAGASSELSAR